MNDNTKLVLEFEKAMNALMEQKNIMPSVVIIGARHFHALKKHCESEPAFTDTHITYGGTTVQIVHKPSLDGVEFYGHETIPPYVPHEPHIKTWKEKAEKWDSLEKEIKETTTDADIKAGSFDAIGQITALRFGLL